LFIRNKTAKDSSSLIAAHKLVVCAVEMNCRIFAEGLFWNLALCSVSGTLRNEQEKSHASKGREMHPSKVLLRVLSSDYAQRSSPQPYGGCAVVPGGVGCFPE
jgi:hypothetical protein